MTKQSPQKLPLTRREAYLLRQERVRERAAKKAGSAAKAPPALRTLPVGRVGVGIRIPAAAFRQDFASAIAKAEQAGQHWAMQPSRTVFAVGDRVSHAKFGGGVVIGVDEHRLTIYFDAVGRKCIIDSFVVCE